MPARLEIKFDKNWKRLARSLQAEGFVEDSVKGAYAQYMPEVITHIKSQLRPGRGVKTGRMKKGFYWRMLRSLRVSVYNRAPYVNYVNSGHRSFPGYKFYESGESFWKGTVFPKFKRRVVDDIRSRFSKRRRASRQARDSRGRFV